MVFCATYHALQIGKTPSWNKIISTKCLESLYHVSFSTFIPFVIFHELGNVASGLGLQNESTKVGWSTKGKKSIGVVNVSTSKRDQDHNK